MNITVNGLLQLGFTEVSKRPHFYTYKAVSGTLDPQNFQINGFKVPLNTMADLSHLLEIIDYYHR